jgi:hypothetical protein
MPGGAPQGTSPHGNLLRGGGSNRTSQARDHSLPGAPFWQRVACRSVLSRFVPTRPWPGDTRASRWTSRASSCMRRRPARQRARTCATRWTKTHQERSSSGLEHLIHASVNADVALTRLAFNAAFGNADYPCVRLCFRFECCDGRVAETLLKVVEHRVGPLGVGTLVVKPSSGPPPRSGRRRARRDVSRAVSRRTDAPSTPRRSSRGGNEERPSGTG